MIRTAIECSVWFQTLSFDRMITLRQVESKGPTSTMISFPVERVNFLSEVSLQLTLFIACSSECVPISSKYLRCLVVLVDYETESIFGSSVRRIVWNNANRLWKIAFDSFELLSRLEWGLMNASIKRQEKCSLRQEQVVQWINTEADLLLLRIKFYFDRSRWMPSLVSVLKAPFQRTEYPMCCPSSICTHSSRE